MASKEPSVLTVGDLLVDLDRARVMRDDVEIPLPRLSLDMLLVLVAASPRVVTLDELMQRIWPGLVVSPETVSQRVKLLRRALGDDSDNPRYIVVVRGRGYRLVPPVERGPTPQPVQRPGANETSAAIAPEREEPLGAVGAARRAAVRERLGRRSVLLAIGVLIAGIAVAVSFGLLSKPRLDASNPPTAAPLRPAIAVLPFDNRSDRDTDAFFVDGIHDDILTQLTKVSAMKVISRASVERFRDTELPLKSIAEQLGVTTILEGGVQRAGDRVRITVQLIDATTDTHLWAENYDRELTATSIFAIQSEVAIAIAAALRTTLTSGEKARVNAVPTRVLAAWEVYQLGKQRMAKRTSASLAEAVHFFQQAIDRDPSFALAYSGLADAIWLLADYSGQPAAPAVAKAEKLLDKALKLDPNLAEALTTSAKFAQDRRDFQRAETEYRQAIENNPNYPTAHHWYSQLLGMQGRDAEALQRMQRAVELDPLSASLQNTLALYLCGLGSFDAALAGFDKARDIDPLSPLPYAGIGAVHATAFGRLDDAVPFIEKAVELDPTGGGHAAQLAQVLLDLGGDERVEHWLNRAGDTGSADAVRGYLYLYRGEQEKAIAYARKAFDTDPRDRRALALLRDADMQAHDAKAARDRYARAFPELLGRQTPEIDATNYAVAIDLALVLQQIRENERAAELLDRSEALIRTLPRMGMWGYQIADAQIYALRGQKPEALAALRASEKAGWRGPLWRYYRDFDPNLASIRNDPEFKAVFADIERHMAQQRARLAARPKIAPLELSAITNR